MVVNIEAADRRLLGGAGTIRRSVDFRQNSGSGADCRRAARFGPEMTRLIEGLGFEIVLVSAAAARRIEPSYAQCGKRDYPAGLSFCNCFALLCL